MKITKEAEETLWNFAMTPLMKNWEDVKDLYSKKNRDMKITKEAEETLCDFAMRFLMKNWEDVKDDLYSKTAGVAPDYIFIMNKCIKDPEFAEWIIIEFANWGTKTNYTREWKVDDKYINNEDHPMFVCKLGDKYVKWEKKSGYCTDLTSSWEVSLTEPKIKKVVYFD